MTSDMSYWTEKTQLSRLVCDDVDDELFLKKNGTWSAPVEVAIVRIDARPVSPFLLFHCEIRSYLHHIIHRYECL